MFDIDDKDLAMLCGFGVVGLVAYFKPDLLPTVVPQYMAGMFALAVGRKKKGGVAIEGQAGKQIENAE